MDTTATSTAITNTMPTQVIALDEDRGGPRDPLNLISFPDGGQFHQSTLRRVTDRMDGGRELHPLCVRLRPEYLSSDDIKQAKVTVCACVVSTRPVIRSCSYTYIRVAIAIPVAAELFGCRCVCYECRFVDTLLP